MFYLIRVAMDRVSHHCNRTPTKTDPKKLEFLQESDIGRIKGYKIRHQPEVVLVSREETSHSYDNLSEHLTVKIKTRTMARGTILELRQVMYAHLLPSI